MLEMPPDGGGATDASAPRAFSTRMTARENPPATLGTLSVLPSAVSYYRRVLRLPDAGPGASGDRPTARASPRRSTRGRSSTLTATFEDISQAHARLQAGADDLRRVSQRSREHSPIPKLSSTRSTGTAFPNVPLLQPRLGSVEEWTFINNNNDEHPIHIHVNDFQVTSYFDPTTGLKTGAEMWERRQRQRAGADHGIRRSRSSSPAALSLRTKFEDYTGLFVMHCHRLNHEDNGLMTLVNVIPAVSTYAVAVPGSPGHAAEVKVYDGNGDRLVATVTPFPGFEGALSVAMGDVDDDNVLDLVVGAGKDYAPRSSPIRARRRAARRAFETRARAVCGVRSERARRRQRDGRADRRVDRRQHHRRLGSRHSKRGQGVSARELAGFARHGAELLFSTFSPYRERSLGRERRLGLRRLSPPAATASSPRPGPGSPAQVKVFNFSLMKPIDHAKPIGRRGDEPM